MKVAPEMAEISMYPNVYYVETMFVLRHIHIHVVTKGNREEMIFRYLFTIMTFDLP